MSISSLTGAGAPTANGLAGALRDLAKPVDRQAVRTRAGAARQSPLMQGSEQLKAQAKARVQAIVERLKVLKKLFGADPKAMARALAQVFKELKAAVDDYRRAGGDEMAAAGQASSAAMATANAEQAATGGDDAKAPPSRETSAPYDAVVTELKKTIGEDGLDFMRGVRSLANDLRDLLESARTQARVHKPEKTLTKALEDADAALTDLNKALDGMERDIHLAAPTAGMKLSMEA